MKINYILSVLLTLVLFSCDTTVEEQPTSTPQELLLVSENMTFHEDFTWTGTHASTKVRTEEPTFRTVWWNSQVWDARHDTAWLAVARGFDTASNGFHIDLHKGYDDITDGRPNNISDTIGGDGTAGVGIMHIDFQGIASARLRNPMLISKTQPGKVSFYAPVFNTTGHWWELAITPANEVTAAEFTSVPSAFRAFADHQGPGHYPYEDSINLITFGHSDVPCITGWDMLVGINSTVDGNTEEVPGTEYNVYPTGGPAESTTLVKWIVEYYPDRVVLYGDMNEDGESEYLNTFYTTIPWSEVYVHLMAVAYQADHHPQGPAPDCYLGPVREIGWKDVSVSPVKYKSIAVYPKEGASNRSVREAGWMNFDLRDNQRPSDLVQGMPQPNEDYFDMYSDNAFCSGGWWRCRTPVSATTLNLELNTDDLEDVAFAQLVYDVKGYGEMPLTVNGQDIGTMIGKDDIEGSVEEDQWVRRSITIDVNSFKSGNNSFAIALSGEISLDRLQLELFK